MILGLQQQTGHTQWLWSHDATDRQTDRQMHNNFIDPALHTMRPVK